MEYVFAVLLGVLAALIIIIFELRKITTWMDQRRNSDFQRGESHETPTINVNLGSLPMQESRTKRAAPVDHIEPKPMETIDPPPEPEPVPEPEPQEEVKTPPKFYHIPPKTTPSGLGITKCPRCAAENSSFRSECFSCGASLH